MEVGGHRQDHITASEGLLSRQASAGSEQLGGETLEVDDDRLIGGPDRLNFGNEVRRWVAGGDKVRLPPDEKVRHRDMILAVPGGPGRNRAGRVRGVGSDCGGDLGGTR